MKIEGDGMTDGMGWEIDDEDVRRKEVREYED